MLGHRLSAAAPGTHRPDKLGKNRMFFTFEQVMLLVLNQTACTAPLWWVQIFLDHTILYITETSTSILIFLNFLLFRPITITSIFHLDFMWCYGSAETKIDIFVLSAKCYVWKTFNLNSIQSMYIVPIHNNKKVHSIESWRFQVKYIYSNWSCYQRMESSSVYWSNWLKGFLSKEIQKIPSNQWLAAFSPPGPACSDCVKRNSHLTGGNFQQNQNLARC